MAISTYANLQTEVAAFLQRDDLTARIPVFVEMATARFNRELRAPEMEALVTTPANAEYTGLPTDFLQIRSIETNGDRMEYLAPEEFQSYVAKTSTPAVPVYTIVDMSLRIYPAPSVSSTLTLKVLYYARIPEMVNALDTNWLLDAHPDAYLFGSLLEAAGFLHDDDRVARWDARLQQAMNLINRRGKQMSQGAASMTIKVA
jgi:hypothetical protein